MLNVLSNKSSSRIIVFLLLAITCSILYTSIKAFDREPPIANVQTRPMNNKSEVSPGGSIIMEYSFTRKSSCDFDVERIVVDSTGKQISLYNNTVRAKTQYEVGDRESVYIPIFIPTSMNYGSSIYYPKVKYYCNWAQKLLDIPIIVPSTPTIFYVVQKKSS